MPQISELFVSLGVKGSEKTISAMTNVKTGLSGIASTSLEVKAAIIGAIYALERLMSTSAQRGTELSNLNALTGISVKTLQQWQYAARQAGESNEEFTSSLKSVYDKMAQMKLNKGAPEGLDILAQTVGFDPKKAYDDIFYVWRKAQEFAHSSVPIDIQNQILKSFGFSENSIAALRKNAFNATNFKNAPFFTEAETKKLTEIGVAFDNLETKVSMFFGHFTAENGKEIVKTLSDITDKIIEMSKAFENILKYLKIFDLLKYIVKDINKNPMDIETQKEFLGKKLIESLPNIEEKKSIPRSNFSIFDTLKSAIIESKLLLNPENLQNNQNFTDYSHGIMKLFDNFVSPLRLQNNPNNNNTNINQNLYFQHEGKDYGEIQNSVNKSIVDAWKQLSAQSQAT